MAGSAERPPIPSVLRSSDRWIEQLTSIDPSESPPVYRRSEQWALVYSSSSIWVFQYVPQGNLNKAVSGKLEFTISSCRKQCF